MNVVHGMTRGIINPNVFRDQMKKFIVDNGIIGTAAGVCIAVSTKDTIQSFVGDIIMPAIYLLLVTLNSTYFSKSLLGKHTIDFPKFLNQFVSWIFVVIMTFVFVRIAFGNLFGVHDSTTISEPDKTAVIAAVTSSSNNK
jgi:large-conductance mechanosensitive channel